jgi:hypothetical protein
VTTFHLEPASLALREVVILATLAQGRYTVFRHGFRILPVPAREPFGMKGDALLITSSAPPPIDAGIGKRAGVGSVEPLGSLKLIHAHIVLENALPVGAYLCIRSDFSHIETLLRSFGI